MRSMKKVLSIIMSLVLIVGSFAMPTSAMANQTVSNQLDEAISQRMQGGAKFLLDAEKEALTVDKAVDFLTYLKSGYDMSAYVDGFVASVEENIKKNGSLVTAYGTGDLGQYGAVISALRILGYDPTSFSGVNLVEQFESMSPNEIYNPYYYRVAIEAAGEDFAISLCDRFIKDYYVMGQGMNYYGFSCDNTAVLIASIAKYKECYADVIRDARTVIAKHTNDDGTFYSHTYNTTSPDSTAMALMAYSAIGVMDLASYMYNNLVNGFESSVGVMMNYGSDDAYATKDALMGFEAYYDAVKKSGYIHNMTLSSSAAYPCTSGRRYLSCKDCDRAVSYNYPAYSEHSYKSKITTAPTCTKSGVRTYTCTVCNSSYTASVKATGHSYTKKVVAPTYLAKGYTLHTCTKCGYKYKDNYVSKKVLATPGSVTLTAGTKYFKVSHKKVSAASGYQIKYSSKKDFSTGITHTYLGADKLTTKHTKLKSNTRYYVRVRAYKKIKSGNKIVRVYSPWSSTKSVVTK
ncbi:MAG: fibronectin type III domain-containing protein, partial [Eubacterium sp.]